MRPIILYIATSIDGYIAKVDTSPSWRFTDIDYGYESFYNSVDTTLMGYNTYQELLKETSFPYKDKTNYVFTKKQLPSTKQVRFVDMPAVKFIKELKEGEGSAIWLVGGGKMNRTLLDNNLIDEIRLTIHPTVLGGGLSLFEGQGQLRKMQLIDHQAFSSGILQITYQFDPHG
jgi:dihydrofolate reductase